MKKEVYENMPKKSSDSGTHRREVIAANSTYCPTCNTRHPGPLGRFVKALRDEMAWRQPEVVRRGGPSLPTQSRVERGDAGVGHEVIAAFAAAYSVDVEDMRAYLSGEVTLGYLLETINMKKDRSDR